MVVPPFGAMEIQVRAMPPTPFAPTIAGSPVATPSTAVHVAPLSIDLSRPPPTAGEISDMPAHQVVLVTGSCMMRETRACAAGVAESVQVAPPSAEM